MLRHDWASPSATSATASRSWPARRPPTRTTTSTSLLEIAAREDGDGEEQADRCVGGAVEGGGRGGGVRGGQLVGGLRLEVEQLQIGQQPVRPERDCPRRGALRLLREQPQAPDQVPDEEEREREGGGE